MKIEYSSNKLKRVCNNYSVAQKHYGADMANLIHRRIGELQAVDSIDLLLQYSVGRCHKLKGNKKNEPDRFAMDLVQPYRLVFTRYEESIFIALILEIVDYH